MITYRCKVCGGMLNITEGCKVVICDYCGNQLTVPNLDSEKKINLFSRADRLRQVCEFDKAAGIYESIIADFPEEAEAYWGLVLCKYGIEYVDDARTGKKVPTCHRSSYDSVLNDENYLATLKYADVMAKEVYQKEAQTLEQIRLKIISVSSNEAPYDIFICYKDTDGKDRTRDSVIAEDIYHFLTAAGYRVFFSRYTLEGKLGVDYEAYIFSALHSARVMVLVGTKYEYFNAVWVKNEWKRYLSMIASGENKTLIPCYEGLDPAVDMPDEIKNLQAQDMDKIGATQNLVHGIDTILGGSPAVQKSEPSKSVATTDSLLQRAHLFLEDGDFTKADEYYEKVLDIDPQAVDAYIGKLMIAFKLRKESDFGKLIQRIDLNPNYKKIMTFGDSAVQTRFTGYSRAIEQRIGKRNAQLQEVEQKKRVITDVIQQADTDVATAQSKINSIQAQMNAKTAHLQGLKGTIEAKSKYLKGKQRESRMIVFPAWLGILLMLAELFCLYLVFTEVIPSDIRGNVFTGVCLSGVLILSTVWAAHSKRANGDGFVGVFIVWLLISGAIYLLILIICAVIDNGGIINVLFALLNNITIGVLSGDKIDIIRDEHVNITVAISSQIFFLIVLIYSCYNSSKRRSSRKVVRALSKDLDNTMNEYNQKLQSDGELQALQNALQEAEAEYKLVFDDCRSKVRNAVIDYQNTATSYSIKYEPMLPVKYQ